MALIVEDGTGLADADAFVSAEDCGEYCVAHGLTDWTDAAADTAADDAAIRRATSWLSNSFRFKGSKLNGRAQALAFPRTDVCDDEGEEVASDEVPTEIVQATCLASAYERANPGGLTPAVVMAERVKRESIKGAVETEFFDAPPTPDSYVPVLVLVRDIIGGLLATTGSLLVGTAVRS